MTNKEMQWTLIAAVVLGAIVGIDVISPYVGVVLIIGIVGFIGFVIVAVIASYRSDAAKAKAKAKAREREQEQEQERLEAEKKAGDVPPGGIMS